jgi:MFS family permease
VAAEADISRPRRLLILGICCMSLLIVGLDTTIVNVALPSIHKDLHASVSGLQWAIGAYTLVPASLLGGAILVLGVLTTTRWANETARRTAQRFPEPRYEPGRVAA